MDWWWLVPLGVLVAAGSAFITLRSMRGVSRYDWLKVQKLNERGADLTKPHELIFSFFFRTSESARAVANRLAKDGFDTTVSQGNLLPDGTKAPGVADETGWRVSARREMLVEMKSMTQLGRQFTGMAQNENGVYVGWEATIKW